ncbi:MAG: DUF2201 family putative metallopeptidase [Actinomycetes bacterium]
MVKSVIVGSFPGPAGPVGGLLGVELTDQVDTAAVTCGVRSRLRMNPVFLAEHCRTDEHLFLLVMHELWHVLLAHTRLYPRPTRAHNIAFDAVINAGLARQFQGREYRGFFDRIYAADRFPERLLRPPEGWPERPRYDGPGPRGTNSVLRQLYRTNSAEMPHWTDVLALLRSSGGAGGLGSEGGAEPVLLGNHDADDADYSSVVQSDLLGPALREMVDSWTVGPLTAEEPGAGRAPETLLVERPDPRRVSREFEVVLRRACRPAPDGDRSSTVSTRLVPTTSVLPSRHDRRQLARHRLGLQTLLHDHRTDVRARQVEQPQTARVYLDVSGSMTDYLVDFLGPLTAYTARGLARTWQFSTTVEPLPLEALRKGELNTTFGTEIDCVLEHALVDPSTTSIVVVTDGYVHEPQPGLVAALRVRGIAVEVVLPADVPPEPLDRIGRVTHLSPRQLGGA